MYQMSIFDFLQQSEQEFKPGDYIEEDYLGKMLSSYILGIMFCFCKMCNKDPLAGTMCVPAIFSTSCIRICMKIMKGKVKL